MLEKTGIATQEMVMNVFPSIERINKGPVAVIECFQNIPCNPCQTACRFNDMYLSFVLIWNLKNKIRL